MKKNTGKGAKKGAGKAKGNRGPFLWTVVPMALFLSVPLILLIIIGLGGTMKHKDYLNTLYFMRMTTSDPLPIGPPPQAQPRSVAENLPSATTGIIEKPDFYHIGLWNSCSGPFKTNPLQTEIQVDEKDASKTDNVTDCTKRQFHFWFNIMQIQGLNQTVASLPDAQDLHTTLGIYKRATKWMNSAYVLSVLSISLAFISNCFAAKSRRNMFITVGITFISSIFLLAFALTATLLYASLVRTFNRMLTTHNIHSERGNNVYVLLWVAFGFTLCSAFLWLVLACRYSGRLNRIKGYQSLHLTPRPPVTQQPVQQHVQNVFIAGPGQQSTPHVPQYGGP